MDLITRHQATTLLAQRLCVREGIADEHIQTSSIKPIRVGMRWWVNRADILALAERIARDGGL